MPFPGTHHPRLAVRLEELRSLKERLTPPSGGGLASRPQELLCGAGDLLRRSSATATELASLDGILRTLAPEAIRTGLSEIRGKQMEEALIRAADEAVEAALAETPEEAEMWSTSAFEGMRHRDRAESILAAANRWVSLGGKLTPDDEELRARLTRDLQALDRKLRAKARWMVGLNNHRRLERDLLEPEARAAAWWYAERAECDDLVVLLSGQAPRRTEHLERCPDCQRDLERSRTVESPPSPHLTSDDAWSYDLGTLSSKEREAIEEHARSCAECAQVLEALAAGELAIEEEAESPPRAAPSEHTVPSATAGLSSTRRPGRHLVAAQPDFRVLLIRDAGRVRLLVQSQTSRGIAAAAVSLLPQRSSLQHRSTAEGLDFDLGDSRPLVGRIARVIVQLPGSASPFERDIEL